MTNLQRYTKVFSEIFNLPEASFDESFTFATTEEWDSIVHMSLVTALEEEFDIMLDTEDILNYGSFENGKRILAKHGVAMEDA
ncbi:MAG: acyl carrier protein [Opitutales bacterium]|nr:acyl carrier protein [Opitutales bacterium]